MQSFFFKSFVYFFTFIYFLQYSGYHPYYFKILCDPQEAKKSKENDSFSHIGLRFSVKVSGGFVDLTILDNL